MVVKIRSTEDTKVLGTWEDGGVRHPNGKASSRSRAGRSRRLWLWTSEE